MLIKVVLIVIQRLKKIWYYKMQLKNLKNNYIKSKDRKEDKKDTRY